jgi:hypothetical protein
MRQHHHHVSAVGAQAQHGAAHGVEDVQRLHLSGRVLAVPEHDLWRHDANDADLQRVRRAGIVDYAPLQQRVRLERGLAAARAGGLHHVDREHRGARTRAGEAQEVQPAVELVVARCRGVVAEAVEQRDGGMHLARGQRFGARHHVAERTALEDLAVVDEQAVARLGACRIDERGRAREAVLDDGAVLAVVPGQQLHVQVGGADEAQLQRLRVHPGRRQDDGDQQG